MFNTPDHARALFSFLRDKEWPGVGYSLNPDTCAMSVTGVGVYYAALEEKVSALAGKEIGK